MGLFENNIERSGYAKKRTVSEFSGAQKSANKSSERALKKEMREGGLETADLLEITIGELAGNLARPENAEIINRIMGEEGASEDLSEKMLQYWERLGNKSVAPDSSAKETFRHIATAMDAYLIRAKKQRESIKDSTKEVIREEFSSLREYIDLLMTYGKFESAELGTSSGYLSRMIGKENADAFRGYRKNYINKCKEILDNREV